MEGVDNGNVDECLRRYLVKTATNVRLEGRLDDGRVEDVGPGYLDRRAGLSNRVSV